jgi:hypothetical protein
MTMVQTFVLLLLLTSCSAVPSDAQTVYVTKTGSKYHADGCRYLSRSKIPIKLTIAKEQGYEPCSVCSPADDEIAEEDQPQTQRRDTVANPVPVMRAKPSSEPTRSVSPSPSAQCSAFTKAGARCKRAATANGKCWQHQ